MPSWSTARTIASLTRGVDRDAVVPVHPQHHDAGGGVEGHGRNFTDEFGGDTEGNLELVPRGQTGDT